VTVDAGASEIAAAALDLGGTLTGEHGIGTAKLEHMSHQFGPVELAAFRAIKRAFDPGGVLNPRVMLPAPEPREPELPAFGQAVAAALSGRTPAARGPPIDSDCDRAISIDAENMTLTAGGAASSHDAAAAAKAAGLSCPAMATDAIVAQLIEGSGNRQPARAALLGIEAALAGGHRHVRQRRDEGRRRPGREATRRRWAGSLRPNRASHAPSGTTPLLRTRGPLIAGRPSPPHTLGALGGGRPHCSVAEPEASSGVRSRLSAAVHSAGAVDATAWVPSSPGRR
jgi:hypothetical protein